MVWCIDLIVATATASILGCVRFYSVSGSFKASNVLTTGCCNVCNVMWPVTYIQDGKQIGISHAREPFFPFKSGLNGSTMCM